MRSNTASLNLIKLQVYPLEIKKNTYFFKERHSFYFDSGEDKVKKKKISFVDNISRLSLQMTILAWLNNQIISILQS